MTQPIKTLIVDDERLARKMLRALLERDEEIEIVGEAGDAQEAVRMIEQQAPNLVFLDVQMPGANGFDVLRKFDAKKMLTVIFVTAFDRYALRAFESQALDYLLKPFDYERFEVALDRAKRQIKLQRISDVGAKFAAVLNDLEGALPESVERLKHSPQFAERLTVKSNGRIFFINVADIDWIEATGDYMQIHVGGEKHLLHETLKNLVSKFDPQKFVRIHRSVVVNIERVRDIQPTFKGESVVTLNSGTKLRISRGYRDNLRKFLG